MQLRKMSLMIAALGLTLAACGGGAREDLSCDSDASCLENEICHPQAKVCVQTCTVGDDCPESAGKCEAITTGSTTLICKCTTDQLCQRDSSVTDASTLSCSKTYSVCTSGTNTPGPTPGASCSGEGQTTSCGYGQFCSSSVCTAVAAPTCANFDPSKGGRTPTFNAATSTGPIIYSVTKSSFAQDSFCGNGSAGSTGLTVKARVKAYTTGTFPSSKSALPGLFYVTVDGDPTDGSALIRPSEYSVLDAGKRAEFTMNFCPGSTATQLTIGLYFTDGNETCAVFNK